MIFLVNILENGHIQILLLLILANTITDNEHKHFNSVQIIRHKYYNVDTEFN